MDAIVVGGDVAPGPMPAECLRLLSSLEWPVHYIMGNGDRGTLLCRDGRSGEVPDRGRVALEWNASQLAEDDVAALRAWPATIALDVDGIGRVLFCHATPRNDTDIFTRLTPEEQLVPLFTGLGAEVVVCGHTHMQFDRAVGRVRVVNAGSVGMPFGEPGAYWLELGPAVTLRRTDYDREKAAERILATTYPQAEEFAAHNVLTAPAEAPILAAVTRSALQ